MASTGVRGPALLTVRFSNTYVQRGPAVRPGREPLLRLWDSVVAAPVPAPYPAILGSPNGVVLADAALQSGCPSKLEE